MPARARMKTLALLALCLPLADTPAAREAAHPWGRWLPGAWVETETRVEGAAGATVERSRLVGPAAEGYVLRLSGPGGEPEGEERTSRWGLGGFAHLAPGARVVGEEEVEACGRAFACTVWEARSEGGGERGALQVDRSWVAPGHELPLRFQSSGPEGSVSMALVALEDFVPLDGRKLRCVRYEGTGRTKGGAFRVRQWSSLEVPGGIVRMESRVSAGGPERLVERQVLAFRGDPRRR